MSFRAVSLGLLSALALASGLGGQTDAQTVAGQASAASVVNTAHLSFGHNGQATTIDSNTTSLAVNGQTIPVLSLMRLSGGSAGTVMDASDSMCASSGGLAPVVSNSVQPFDPAAVKLSPATRYEPGDPIFVKVVAPDSNLDPNVRDTIQVVIRTGSNDSETVTIRETGPNTGVFVGFVNSDDNVTGTVGDCSLALFRDGAVTGWFTDVFDPSAILTDTALVDPFGFVFSSATALPVSGAAITLIDDATGKPATVFGVDGVSAYPSTVTTGATVVDAGGKIYPNRPGEYKFPLAAPGSYHLLIAPPVGYTAPSTAPLATLQTLITPINTSFVLLPASFGKSFTLVVGTDIQIDVPIDPHKAGLLITKTASVTDASLGDIVQYHIQLQNPVAATPAPATVITDVMPRGFRYVAGSARRDGVKIPDPTLSGNGQSLTFPMGSLAGGASTEVRYVVRLSADVQVGDAVNRATATDGLGDQSDVAEALIHVRPPFFTDAATLIGRVIEGDCSTDGADRKGVPGVRLVLEDGTFVISDKDGRFHVEGVHTGTHVVQMDVDSVPTDLAPQTCGRNTRTGGSAFSQFVELKGGDLWRVDFHLRRLSKAVEAKAVAAAAANDASIAGEGHDWLAGQTIGPPAFLFPAPDYNPRSPTTMAAIKHAASDVVMLTVNGVAADPLALDGDAKSADGRIAVITWRGLPLHDGDNTLEATISEGHGGPVTRLTRIVHYANTAAQAALVPERSRLIADGLMRPIIALRIMDRAGHPVRNGVMGSFTVAAPYSAAAAVDAMQKRQLSGLDGAGLTWRVVGDEGVALIELAPTSQAGPVQISLPMAGDRPDHPTQLAPWLSADREKWMVVGFGAGTLGFNTLSHHVDPLLKNSGHPGFSDGQLAFYAKGRIRGSWLLTIAYDNKRAVDSQRGLLSAIDPDRYYTVYGDGAAQGYDASTQKKLYLRLERKAFYALFGDFQTGFDQTELGRYTRVMNGFKFERQGKVINVSGFSAETDQVSIRDEIQGLGLSGPYRLSTQNLTPHTEEISVETRDRDRAERIISTQVMSRNVDYDIDYATGEITFNAPVLSVDAGFNPNIIVAQYEVESNGVKALQVGLRASATLLAGKLKVGATLLHDGQKLQTASGDVAATDVIFHPRADTTVKLEAAVSNPNAEGVGLQTAYLAQIDHHSAVLDLLGYYRQEDAAYGLNEQSASELGASKVGLDGKIRLGHGFGLTATGYHESYMASGATRDNLDARIDYGFGDWKLNAGLKFVQDSTSTTGLTNSDLLTLGASRDFLAHRLQLTATSDIALGKAESVDFPARRRLAASYAFTKDIRVILSHEIVDGTYSAQTTRLGVEVEPWKGGHLTGGMNEQAITENGQRTFAQFGMIQTLTLSKQWTVDAAFDSSSTLSGQAPTNTLLNVNQPAASGGTTFATVSQTGAPAGVVAEDFDSVSLGATYRAKTWSWNARAEVRVGQIADTWNLRSNWLRELGAGVVEAISARASDTNTSLGAASGASEIDGSLAWRPLKSQWSVLDKLTLRDDVVRGTAAGQVLAGFGALALDNGSSGRIVNNLAVNYASDAEGEHGRGQFQVSAYYGAKYVQGRFDDDTYTGFVDVVGLNGSVDVSPSVDVGLNLAVEHAWSDHNLTFAIGPSVGLSPMANSWISVGWNLVGFRDRDFQQAAYTQDGPYITTRFKFDQLTLAPLLNRLQGRAR